MSRVEFVWYSVGEVVLLEEGGRREGRRIGGIFMSWVFVGFIPRERCAEWTNALSRGTAN